VAQGGHSVANNELSEINGEADIRYLGIENSLTQFAE
jgi:hypothetical protein